MPALLLLLSLLLFTFTFYFLLFLFTFYLLFHILSSILHPTTPIGVVNNDQRIWMPALLLQMLFHPTFSITTSPHFASGKQGQSIYFILLCTKSKIFSKSSYFSVNLICFLLLVFFNRPAWSIRIWTIFRYLAKTNSHWWSDRQYWT